MTLPKAVQDAAEAAAIVDVNLVPGETIQAPCAEFMNGVEWLYAYLSVQQYRMVTSDDDVAALKAEIERLRAELDAAYWRFQKLRGEK